MPNIIMADQPSGFGYKLLGSGTYTKADSVATITIPVTYTGEAKLAIVKATAISGSAHASMAQKYISSQNDTTDPPEWNFNGAVAAQGKKADDTSTQVAIAPYQFAVSATQIQINQINTSYKWVANTYKWYIYGEA